MGNSKGRPFPTGPMIIALLYSQHKLIESLNKGFSKIHVPNIDNDHLLNDQCQYEFREVASFSYATNHSRLI